MVLEFWQCPPVAHEASHEAATHAPEVPAENTKLTAHITQFVAVPLQVAHEEAQAVQVPPAGGRAAAEVAVGAQVRQLVADPEQVAQVWSQSEQVPPVGGRVEAEKALGAQVRQLVADPVQVAQVWSQVGQVGAEN